jgi:hypothetical protein
MDDGGATACLPACSSVRGWYLPSRRREPPPKCLWVEDYVERPGLRPGDNPQPLR